MNNLPPCGQSKPCTDKFCPWPKFEERLTQDENDDDCLVEHCARCDKIVSLTVLSKED